MYNNLERFILGVMIAGLAIVIFASGGLIGSMTAEPVAYIQTTADTTMTDSQARAYCKWHAEDDYQVEKLDNDFIVSLTFRSRRGPAHNSKSIIYRAATEQEARSFIAGALSNH